MPENVELTRCDSCGTGVCVALAWEDGEPQLVLSCNCRGVPLISTLESDVTPPEWK